MKGCVQIYTGDGKGKTTAACCIIHPDRGPEPVEIPDWFAQALEGDAEE